VTDVGDPLQGADRIAVDDTHVYWLNLRGEVMRVPISGGKVERVANTQPNPAWIELDDQFVYFSTLGGEIFRVSKEGGTPVLLVPAKARPAIFLQPGAPYPLEFRLASNQLQWADGTGVYSCPVTGCSGAPQTLDSEPPGSLPFSFATDASGRMYASVEVHEMDASSATAVSYAMSIFRDGQWLGFGGPTAYYELLGGANEVYALATTDVGPTGVVRWADASVTFLASGVAIPGATRGLALDADFAYWPNAAPAEADRQKRTASVVRCAKTGCASPEVLADAQLVPRAVAVSSEAVYWTTGDGNVMKVAKPIK
jgi:sugar lactone lactonase YvrE